MDLIYPNSLEQVIHSIKSSKLNTRYIQPVKQLGEHIFSHSIQPETWLAIYTRFKARCMPIRPKVYLQTVYHDNNRKLIDRQSGLNQTRTVEIHFRNDHLFIPNYDQELEVSLEYIGENRYTLSNDSFPILKEYSHERQSIVYVFMHPMDTYYLEMEILIPGLESYDNREELLKLPVEQLIEDKRAFSLSYRLFINNAIHKEEIEELLSDLY